jgi:hypothetical protein
MTIWYTLQAPQCERRIAQSLGAEFDWHTKTWSCSKGRYQSEAFRRWRSRTTWTTFLVFVDFTEVAQAKQAAGFLQSGAAGSTTRPLARTSCPRGFVTGSNRPQSNSSSCLSIKGTKQKLRERAGTVTEARGRCRWA